MAAFLLLFTPKFSSITAPLRCLTEKNAKWKWGEEEQSAFEFVRDSISNILLFHIMMWVKILECISMQVHLV